MSNAPDNDHLPSTSPELAAVLGPALLLPKLALLQLFALPGDALPQGITRLTGLTQDNVWRFAAFSTPAEYAYALRHEAARFYCYALAGWLAYQTVLGEAVRARLHAASPAAAPEALPLAELVAENMVRLLEGCVPTPTRAVRKDLEALFAAEQYGLVPLLDPLPAEASPPAPAADDDDIWSRAKPLPPELNLFGMALNLTVTASYGVAHPLGAALPGVAALNPPAELLALAARCKAATAQEAPELPLTGPDVIRIYLCLQVLALLCVADLQPQLMQRLNPELDSDEPWTGPEQQQDFVTYVCTQAEAFGLLFDNLFGEEPTYQAAKATARELAALV